MAQSYEQSFPELASVYLEDSWVLAAGVRPEGLTFELDAVLTPEHAGYKGALQGEQHDYRRARLVLEASQLDYRPSSAPGATDANGEVDLGNIDSWVVDELGWSRLTGDWGTAVAWQPKIRFMLDAEDEPTALNRERGV
jgi:hypothetical protein